jgi:hypothetical protein
MLIDIVFILLTPHLYFKMPTMDPGVQQFMDMIKFVKVANTMIAQGVVR